MYKKYRQENQEVIYTTDKSTFVSQEDINKLKQLSQANTRKRFRLCAHSDQENSLHEMLIVHALQAYVRPHKHLDKSESIHIIDGLVDILLFDESGNVKNIIEMGDYSSGKIFFFRMEEAIFHMLIIRSDVLVFHETTNGPFKKLTTVFPSWAPDESDPEAVAKFIAEVNRQIDVKVNA